MLAADRVARSVWVCASRGLGLPQSVLRRLPRPWLRRWLRWRLEQAERELDRANAKVDALLAALEGLT